VKWFDWEKGHGFISPDEGGEDLFVHYLAIEGSGHRSLEEGERVSYEPARGRKGEQAANVRRVVWVGAEPLLARSLPLLQSLRRMREERGVSVGQLSAKSSVSVTPSGVSKSCARWPHPGPYAGWPRL
jgi:CspA family cold shock protein